MPAQERSSEEAPPSWRATGAQLWLPALMLGLFALQSLVRLYSLVVEPPPHVADGVLLTIALMGSGTAAAGLLVARRTRVTLTPGGIDIRGGRRRLVAYADVERAHRSRWSRAAVTLDLRDGGKLVLPAPVSALKDPAPVLDEAVDEINARVRATRPGMGDGPPG